MGNSLLNRMSIGSMQNNMLAGPSTSVGTARILKVSPKIGMTTIFRKESLPQHPSIETNSMFISMDNHKLGGMKRSIGITDQCQFENDQNFTTLSLISEKEEKKKL